jgi:hypothetical protein
VSGVETSRVSVVDICQRYVFPIPGSIFLSFSYCSLVIYDQFIDLLRNLICAGYGLLPLSTLYVIDF